jgi:hypothetical protein
MAEYEELRIVVSLTDQASEPLRRFQDSMKETTQGRTSKHVEEFSKKANVAREGLKMFGLEATGTTAKIEALATRVSALGGGLATLAAAIIIATDKVGKMAEAMNQTSRAWEAMGTTLAHGRNITEQLARMGVNEQKAMELTGAAIRAHVQSQSRGMTDMFRQLRDLGLKFGVEFEEQYRRELSKAKGPEDYLNVAVETEEKIKQAILDKNHGVLDDNTRAMQAEATRRFREIQGFNDELLVLTRISNLTKEQEQFWNRMDENAKKISEDWRATWANIDQIWQLIKGDAFDPEISPFPKLMKIANAATALLYRTILTGNQSLAGKNFWLEFFSFAALGPMGIPITALLKFFREHGQEHQAAPHEMPPPWTMPQEGGGTFQGMPQPFASLGAATGNEDLDQNTRELKRLNDQLYQMLHPPEAARGGAGADGGDGTSGSKGADGSPATSTDTSSSTTTTTPTTTPTTTAPTTTPMTVKPPAAFPLPPTPAVPPILGLGAGHHTMPTSSAGSMPFIGKGEGGGGLDDIPTGALGAIRGIGHTETAYEEGQAYSNTTNQGDYKNYDVAGKKLHYDSGFYQNNKTDVNEAVNVLGMSRSQAVHLRGYRDDSDQYGDPKLVASRRSSYEEQTLAMNEFLKRKYPKQYQAAVDGDPEPLRKEVADTHPKWFGPSSLPKPGGGLKGRPKDYRAEVTRTKLGRESETRVGAASVLGGSTLPEHAQDTFASFPSRNIIDGEQSGATHNVQSNGHVQIDIPHPHQARPNSGHLFNRTPPRRRVQMQPAEGGPSEPSRGTASLTG